MKIVFSIILVLFAVSVLLLCGCNSFSSKPKGPPPPLTVEEKTELVEYARNFLLNSKIPLTTDDQQIIRSRPPEIRGYCSAPQEGKMTLSWKINDNRFVNVIANGPFFETDCSWKVTVYKIESK